MPTNLAPPPLQTPLVEPPLPGRFPTWQITRVWHKWFQSVTDRVETSAYAVASALVALQNQTASIGLTSLVPLASSGLYRVSWRFRVATAGGVSSSLQLSIVTTDRTVTVTQSTAAYTGNSTAAPQSGSFLVRCDASVPLQYTTTYASAGVPAMAYDLDISCELL